MNRLTERKEIVECYRGECQKLKQEIPTCDECQYIDKAISKLAAYEDTGLEPEQVKQLNDAFTNSQKKLEKAFDELLKYKDLEEQGLLIKLPCRLGDTVYQIIYDRTIENYKVIGFEIDERGQLYVRVLIERPAATLKLSYQKEDLYFSREEAEKALEEKGE